MSVRYALLELLAQRPCHGYELHSTLLSIVGGQENWDLKPAQIYTTLSHLENNFLVRQAGLDKESGPEKRIYAITPKGKEDVFRWFKEGVNGRYACRPFNFRRYSNFELNNRPLGHLKTFTRF
jgi:DNA-binding PadR family transcriptional regulator